MRTKQTSKRIRTVRRHRLALALVGAIAMPMAPAAFAQNLPESGAVMNGSATIGNAGNTMTITQTTKGAIIDWGSFSIGSGYGVTFDQQFGNTSVTLNRVVGFGYGPGLSAINGTLSANGSVFIVNTAGVIFGGGAQVNVGSLVASTMSITNADFNAGLATGHYQFQPGAADVNSVNNLGSITTASGGTVGFIGAAVTNSGTITAPGGSVVFGSGQQVTLDFFGDGLTQITVNGAGVVDQPPVGCEFFCEPVNSIASNSGTIAADGGQIVMRVAAVADNTEPGIINTGTLRAQGMVSRAGRIELTAPGGGIEIGGFPDGFQPGVIDVSGGGNAGGTVVLRGQAVSLQATSDEGSSIDASGASGGTVDIGADLIRMLSMATINADGAAGGGTINLAANGLLFAFGQLSARGGTAGGGINTSASLFDIRSLRVDAGSAGGTPGTWTLSAPNLNVIHGSDFGSFDPVQFGQDVQDAEINYALDTGTNVNLRAGTAPDDGGYVNFQDGVDIFYDDGTAPLEFRVDAQAAITGSNFRIASNAAPLSMAFNADANSLNNGFAGISFSGATLDSNGGSILFYGQSDTAGGFASSYATGVELADSTIATNGGNVLIRGASTGADAGSDDAGVVLDNTSIDAGAGAVSIYGTGEGITSGVILDFSDITAGIGGVTIDGQSVEADGLYADGSDISTSGGDISLTGAGAADGVYFYGGLYSGGGDIVVHGDGGTGDGVDFSGPVDSAGGDITMYGSSTGAIGLDFGGGYYSGIVSAGGDISLTGHGATGGVVLQESSFGSGPVVLFAPSDVDEVDSGGGDITVTGTASAAGAIGVYSYGVDLVGGAGDVSVLGNAASGTGVSLAGGAGIGTTTGGIAVTGIGLDVGLALAGGELTTDSGHFDLRGRGTGAASDGLVIGQGVSIATNGGGIELSGEGGSGAGLLLQSGSSVDAGDSLVVIRAGNDGSSDALRIGGTISSGMAVNLHPGGVDANGGLTERTADEILVGGGTTGFALSGAELAMIDTPQLVVGSNLHAGAIRVLGATTRDGNLTLQNDGGSGGIDIQAALDVGDGVLALSSGGDITQAASGAITAHSLLARAGGDVLLANANNNVAANTLAGSSGGDFEYQDVDALAIGSVSAAGFDTASNGLSSLGANGIAAGGDVFVRNLAGDMILNAGVSGANIDLVTANTLQNLGGASIVASGDWRVWANTWVGETRGGLAGDGSLPNLYGCAYLGQCGVTVPSADNHFIYVQQPTALIAFDDFTREYGLPNPVFTFTVSGAILGDSAANVATGTGTTTATIGSNVGLYPITGNFTSAAGYRIQFVPGTLAITPATLLFTADQFVRYLGTENPLFTGTVTGFRNGDTVQSVFGSGVVWNSPAGILSPIGFYPVNGGTSATNYVFTQAPGNATALQIIPLPQLSSTPIDLIRETVNTYVYDRNFGGAPMCALNATLDDQQLASSGDELSNEWSKVRSRPNLTNCFETERKNSCGDF